jgi:hypothetical protein
VQTKNGDIIEQPLALRDQGKQPERQQGARALLDDAALGRLRLLGYLEERRSTWS